MMKYVLIGGGIILAIYHAVWIYTCWRIFRTEYRK